MNYKTSWSNPHLNSWVFFRCHEGKSWCRCLLRILWAIPCFARASSRTKPSNMFPLPCHFCSSSTVCPKGCSMLVMQDRMKATILSWTTCTGSWLVFLDTWAAEPTKPLYPETEYLLATLLESEKHGSEVYAANSVTAVCKPKCSNTLAVKVLPPYQPAPQSHNTVYVQSGWMRLI